MTADVLLFLDGKWVAGSCGRSLPLTNPATGETISIAASRKLTFTPAKAVKDKLNG